MAVEILPPFVMMVVTVMANGDEFRSYGPVFGSDRECHAFANNMRHEVSLAHDELPFRDMTWFCGGIYSEDGAGVLAEYIQKGKRMYVVRMNLTPTNR
jgi:hypothetical protein